MTEADSSSKAHLVQDATEVAEFARSGRLQTEEMVLNVGPQHPATHGVFRLLLTIDGELITNAEPIIGYMHRGYEKLVEVRDYRQITNLVSRMDWLSGMNNELPLNIAIERLMEIDVPPRAQFVRVVMCEMNRILNPFDVLSVVRSRAWFYHSYVLCIS